MDLNVKAIKIAIVELNVFIRLLKYRVPETAELFWPFRRWNVFCGLQILRVLLLCQVWLIDPNVYASMQGGFQSNRLGSAFRIPHVSFELRFMMPALVSKLFTQFLFVLVSFKVPGTKDREAELSPSLFVSASSFPRNEALDGLTVFKFARAASGGRPNDTSTRHNGSTIEVMNTVEILKVTFDNPGNMLLGVTVWLPAPGNPKQSFKMLVAFQRDLSSLNNSPQIKPQTNGKMIGLCEVLKVRLTSSFNVLFATWNAFAVEFTGAGKPVNEFFTTSFPTK